MGGVCCRFMIGVLEGVPSPFGRLVATRATEGLVVCATCRVLYSFHQLDSNDAQTLRVFSLAPVIGCRLDALVKAQETLLPRWPRWHRRRRRSSSPTIRAACTSRPTRTA